MGPRNLQILEGCCFSISTPAFSSQRGRHSPSVCFTSKRTWQKPWQWLMHSKHPVLCLSPHLSAGRRQQEIRRSGGAWTSARSSNVCLQRPLLADAGPGAFVTTREFPQVGFFPLFCKLNNLAFHRSEKWLRNKREVEQRRRTWPGEQWSRDNDEKVSEKRFDAVKSCKWKQRIRLKSDGYKQYFLEFLYYVHISRFDAHFNAHCFLGGFKGRGRIQTSILQSNFTGDLVPKCFNKVPVEFIFIFSVWLWHFTKSPLLHMLLVQLLRCVFCCFF